MRYFYLDRHVCVVFKPSGLLVVKNSEHESDLISLVKRDLEEKYAPKKIWIAPIHFLDRDVSGPIIFALSSKAATRINEQMRAREIFKSYRALCYKENSEVSFDILERKKIQAFLTESPKQQNLVQVFAKKMEGSQEAIMFVRKISERHDKIQKESPRFVYLEVELETGRKHQIRALLAHLGYPIVGDPWYGKSLAPREKFAKRLHLRSHALRFRHPVETDKLIDVKTF